MGTQIISLVVASVFSFIFAFWVTFAIVYIISTFIVVSDKSYGKWLNRFSYIFDGYAEKIIIGGVIGTLIALLITIIVNISLAILAIF